MDGKVDREKETAERFSVLLYVCAHVCVVLRACICGDLLHEVSQGNPVYLSLSFSSQS